MTKYDVDNSDEEIITGGIENLSIEENEKADSGARRDYYVHIDVLKNSSALVSTSINRFMIECDSFDPRRAKKSPTLMLIAGYDRDNLTTRRKKANVSSGYYELWRVRKDLFFLDSFASMVQSLPVGTVVQIVQMMHNSFEVTQWCGQANPTA
jgi:hypothetical protein